jgi:hypothetical protein
LISHDVATEGLWNHGDYPGIYPDAVNSEPKSLGSAKSHEFLELHRSHFSVVSLICSTCEFGGLAFLLLTKFSALTTSQNLWRSGLASLPQNQCNSDQSEAPAIGEKLLD